MTKVELAKTLADIMVGNWILTGFKGDAKEARKSIFKSKMSLTKTQLISFIENTTIVK